MARNRILAALQGSDGDDTLRGTAGADTLAGLAGDDLLSGLGAADSLVGGSGHDTLFGGDGDDVLHGGMGLDQLDGGNGRDSLAGGDGADRLLGGAGSDMLWGGAGNDLLNGGAFTDRASYDGFSRRYEIGVTAIGRLQIVDTFAGSGDVGSDQLIDIERLRFDDGVFVVTKGTNGYRIDGTAAADWINAKGAGPITVAGGAGDDTYSVNETLDAVVESADQGVDTVRTLVSYTLPANVENLVLLGSEPINGTGNTLANTLTGNPANNKLLGVDGNDTIVGGDGDDSLGGAAGSDSLVGGAGDDTLVAGGGRDTLEGGEGDDFYTFVWKDDIVIELPDSGSKDKIYSYNNRTLDANVEILYLYANATIGAGNVSDNALYANDKLGSSMDGALGNDSMFGGRAADTLYGSVGDDTLQGTDTLTGGYTNPVDGKGDTLYGGDGSDTYYVFEAADLVVEQASAPVAVRPGAAALEPDPEAAGSNIDTVIAQISYTLRANVENLQLAGNANLDGTGNELDNLLTGNGGANRLQGLAGVDILDGGAGNDTLEGGAGRDTLGGGGGADTLAGGAGNDLLIGGAGSDVFLFDAALVSNVDTISDFVPSLDRFRLDDDVFSAFTAGVAVTTAQLRVGAGLTQAATAAHRLIYNTTTGDLYYDADGAGGSTAVRFAQLGTSTHPAGLAAGDFLIGA